MHNFMVMTDIRPALLLCALVFNQSAARLWEEFNFTASDWLLVVEEVEFAYCLVTDLCQ